MDLNVFLNKHFGYKGTFQDSEGFLWWPSSKVCSALDISLGEALAILPEDDHALRPGTDPKGPEMEVYFRECGVYLLLMRSDTKIGIEFNTFASKAVGSILTTGSFVMTKDHKARGN